MNPIVGGTTLIREAIRSPDYVPGVSGWTINRDGTVEFNNAVIRGQLDVTSPSGAFIRTFVDSNVAQILMQPPDSATSGVVFGAANIFCQSSLDKPLLVIEGPTIEQPSFVGTGEIFVGADPVLSQTGAQMIAQQVVLGQVNGGGVWLSTLEVLSQISTFDGNVQINGTLGWGSAVTQQVRDTSVTNGTTTSTTFTGTLTTTGRRGVAFVAPPSGEVTVLGWSGGFNSTATQYTITDFEVREGSTVGSGIVVRASDENTASQFQSDSANQGGQHSVGGLVIGLTPGDPYNAELTYRVTANTGTWNRRKIMVTPTF